MARPSAIVTDAELSVLNHLWEHGPSVCNAPTFCTSSYESTDCELFGSSNK